MTIVHNVSPLGTALTPKCYTPERYANDYESKQSKSIPPNGYKRHKLGDFHFASLSNCYLNWRSRMSETRLLK